MDRIHITDKKDCCGCTSCASVCPRQCITMTLDKEGFLYPGIEESLCINCGLCEKRCPVIHRQDMIGKPLKIYAARNTDEEIRMRSSSGGIFSLLAEQVLEEGGVVFGARFDNHWEVVHDYTESKDELSAFRGSKYVQSRLGDSFLQVETFLKTGRTVLFSGTPCQIAGLKLFLHHEYNNLLTVDFVCHGVPSPKVWRRYLIEKAENRRIHDIDFRSKKEGWKKFSFSLSLLVNESGETVSSTSVFYEDIYMKAFLSDLILRPSCYACPFKSGRAGSDVTIGDFWGIENILPEIDDDKGVSLVLLNNEKSLIYYKKMKARTLQISSYEEVVRGNPNIAYSVNRHPNRGRFFKRLDEASCLETLITKNLKYSFFYRVKQRIKRELYK
mgnify:FL=1